MNTESSQAAYDQYNFILYSNDSHVRDTTATVITGGNSMQGTVYGVEGQGGLVLLECSFEETFIPNEVTNWQLGHLHTQFGFTNLIDITVPLLCLERGYADVVLQRGDPCGSEVP